MVRRPRPRLVLWILAPVVFASILGALRLIAEAGVPPKPARWVTDTAQMISEQTRAHLDARLERYERKTGHQVVVWIGQTAGGEPIDDFAVQTFHAWGIGRKGHDDGLLMVVLARDRKIDIEVGYGLESRVTDALSRRIIDDVMAPRLREGKADEALSEGVDAVLTAIEGHPVPDEPGEVDQRNVVHLSPLGWLALAVLAGLFLLFLGTHPAVATYFLFSIFSGGGGFGGGGSVGGFRGGGGRSGGGGARGGW